MIAFMVLGLPRSGTAWAANWLTTDKTICLHNPMSRYTPKEIEKLEFGDRIIGISCTSSWMLGDWVDKHPAPKIILEKDSIAVNQSLQGLDLPPLSLQSICRFKGLKGKRVDYHYLFNKTLAPIIWEHLIPNIPFDEARHHELCGHHIQPNHAVASQGIGTINNILEQIRRSSNEA